MTCHVVDDRGSEQIRFDRQTAEELLARGRFFWLDLDQPLSLVVHRHSNPDVGHPGPRIACGNFALSE